MPGKENPNPNECAMWRENMETELSALWMTG